MRIRIGFIVTAMLVSSLGIWAKQDKNHNDAFVQGTPDESRIAKQVRHELLMLPYYGIIDDLAFRVDNTTVTLFGAVTRPTLKSDAENVVKRIEGVTNVINKIEVLPLAPMDDQIRRAEYRAIYGDPLSRLSWKWRERSAVKITGRTHEEATEALQRRRESRHSEAAFAGGSGGFYAV